MNKNTLKKFAKLRAELEQEYATIQTQLKEVEAALGDQLAVPPAEAPAATRGRPKGKGKMSAAGRAAISAAAKARWAKVNAAKATTAAAPASEAAAKPKRKMSAAGKAAIAAAAKARWAKVRAAKAKAAK